MSLKFGSVCSGIEAASQAWESLGWQAVWLSASKVFSSFILFNSKELLTCCLGLPNINVLADHLCRRSPSSVLRVEKSEYRLPASPVEWDLSVCLAGLKEHALVCVQISLEQRLLQIRNQKKSASYVSIAESREWCRLPIQAAGFARRVVVIPYEKRKNLPTGKVELHQSVRVFFHRQSGLLYESLSGSEMQSVVADANRFTMKIKKCITFIILGVGQSSQNYGQILQTLFYCVSTVINLFTQKKTPIRNLCVLKNHLLMAWLGQQIQNYLDRLSAQECAA